MMNARILPDACGWLLASAALLACLFARAEPLPMTLLSMSNETTAGFLVGADKDSISISLEPTGRSTFKMPLTSIQSMNVEDPKAWAPAVAAFQSGNHADAERQFAALAQTYAPLVPLKDSYGSLARLYQFLCLREQGKYDQLAALMDQQLATPLSLGDHYLDDWENLQGWAIVGKKDWLALGSYIKKYEDEQPIKTLPQPPFKRMRSARLASLAYLRGLWNEFQEKNLTHALIDYHRAMTLDLGSNATLTAKAALAALKIVDQQLQENPGNAVLKTEAWSLAVILRDVGGKTAVPAALAKYLEKPPEPAAKTESAKQ